MSQGVRHRALVAFDLGGVLVRICRDWQEGCRAAGVGPTADPAMNATSLRSLVSDHQRGELDHHDFCHALARCAGPSLDAATAAAVHRAWILGEYQGVPALLERLRDSGHDTACLSNTNAPHWEQLQAMPFFGLLRHRHASHLMRLEKPDPRIFRAFERAVGALGEAIAYFDDLPDNCAAARDAGWRVHQVDPGHETVPQMERALQAWGLLP